MKLPAAAALFGAFSFWTAAATTEVPLQSFEDGTTEGWILNTEGWAGGFLAVENSTSNATKGSRSLKARFDGQPRRWGAYRKDLGDSLSKWGVQYGGILMVDVTIPSASGGVQEIGLSVQQPDVTGALNWQEIWFPVTGAGVYTVNLPFQRTGSVPVTLNLGQSAPSGTFEIFVDNIRVLPNAAPVKTFIVPRGITLFSFESDADQFQAEPIATISDEAGHATDGARSLKISSVAGSRAPAARRTGINDPGLLSEIPGGATLMADVTVVDSSELTEIGLGLAQAGGSTREIWLSIPGPGVYTLSMPFGREGNGALEVYLGRNARGPTEFYLDHVRLVMVERVGGKLGTLAIEPLDGGEVKVHYSGALESALNVTGSFTQTAAGGDVFKAAANGDGRFFRARDWVGILFSDDFEADAGWTTTSSSGVGWRRINFSAHTGTFAWGVADDFTSSYPESTVTSLVSPVIDLSNAGASKLTYYQILDIGGEFETDLAEILIRTPAGDPLPGFPTALYQSAQRVGVHSWERREIDLPASALGQKVRLEFRFTSDAFTPFSEPQAGWFLDDVRVSLKP